MKTMANAVKYDRLAGGDCMSATTCFGCSRGNWNELETTSMTGNCSMFLASWLDSAIPDWLFCYYLSFLDNSVHQ